MHKRLTALVLAALAAGSFPLATSAALAEDAAEQGGHYLVDSTMVGTLLDDPAAAAVLEKLIPSVYSNEMFQTMGRSQTLKDIQQYEPVALSDENLAKIQAEFDRLANAGG